MSAWWKRRLVMSLDSSGPIKRIEYVPGGTPYFWIGDADGNFYAAIDGEDLLDFIRRAYRENADLPPAIGQAS